MATDDYTQMWYLADCQSCEPVLSQPFSTIISRDEWAALHTEATGHSVIFRETPKRKPHGLMQVMPSAGLAAARQALADNPLTPEQVSNYIRAQPLTRDEFYAFIERTGESLTAWQENMLDRFALWNPPADGDVLPNGMQHHYHARIDRSGTLRLNIGRH